MSIRALINVLFGKFARILTICFLSFSRLVARLGEYDLSKVEDCVDGVCADKIVRIDVEKIIVHPGYDGKSHDIAVLKLSEDAPYTGKSLSLITLRFNFACYDTDTEKKKIIFS